MIEKIRSFIAVELGLKTQKDLKEIQNQFTKLDLSIKWIAPTNMHLTLKFLGDIDPAQAAAITSALTSVTENLAPHDFTISSLGTFPRIKRPKIFFASIADHNLILADAATQIEAALSQIGFAKENRTFRSHITLGRFRSLKNIDLFKKEMLESSLSTPINFCFNNVTFFKSTLTPSGPIYEIIEKFNL